MYTRSILLFLTLLLSSCEASTSKLDTQPPPGATTSVVNDIAPNEALPRVRAAYAQFVDVRTAEEYAAGHAERAVNIPLDELPAKLDRIEKNEPVYLICQTGRRSREASNILVKNGYKWVFNVDGGTSAWQSAGLPMTSPRPSKN